MSNPGTRRAGRHALLGTVTALLSLRVLTAPVGGCGGDLLHDRRVLKSKRMGLDLAEGRRRRAVPQLFRGRGSSSGMPLELLLMSAVVGTSAVIRPGLCRARRPASPGTYVP
jgi:hypothetical protein